MSNRAWMPLHITDYLADTGHLTATEHGAYMLLIMHYWQNGHLPENEKLIARIGRMTTAQWDESRDVIAMLFGPGWTHKRIDAELSKADDIIEKRRAAAESRYSKVKPSSDANAVQVDSNSSYTGVPPTTVDSSSLRSEQIEKKRERNSDFDEIQFQRWFSSWPTFPTDDRDRAIAAWTALSTADRGAVEANTPAYIAAVKASKRDTWHAADKYLSKRMWERVKGKPPPPSSREEYLAAELKRAERSWK